MKQRITLRAQLTPLDLKETAAYVAGRLRIAGGVVSDIFTKQAVMAIYEISNGLPRIINVLSDNALMGGFAAQSKPVDTNIVREVGRDFDFGITAPAPAAAPLHGSHLALGAGPSREPADSGAYADRPAAPRALGPAQPADAVAPQLRPTPADAGVSDTVRRKRFRFF